jgi:hypothetical protein
MFNSSKLEDVCRKLFGMLRPDVFTDVTAVNGAAIKTARQMGIEAHGLDAPRGFNILKHRVLNAVGKWSDLVLSHPRYHDVVVAAATLHGGRYRPDQLSPCLSDEEFLDKLSIALNNQRHATRPGGYYGIIIGDVPRGRKCCPYHERLIERVWENELVEVLYKPREHLGIKVPPQTAIMYYPFQLEAVLLWRRRSRISGREREKAESALVPSQKWKWRDLNVA